MLKLLFFTSIAILAPLQLMKNPVSASARTIASLSEIPSGSGLELINGKLFIVGDDSPFLFALDPADPHNYKSHKIVEGAIANRIDKVVKPDFEAITSETRNGKNFIYVFGSGGISPYRESLTIIETGKQTASATLSLKPFYSEIIKRKKLTQNQLNIEAAVIKGDDLFLFNRGVNFIIKTNVKQFLLSVSKNSCPEFSIHHCKLPTVEHNLTGFSGAASVDGTDEIVITATAEATTDFIMDGEIAGSYVAILTSTDIVSEKAIQLTPITDEKGIPLKQKIESVAVRSNDKSFIETYAIADNDNGLSVLFDLKLKR